MNKFKPLVTLLVFLAPLISDAQQHSPVASESRDASLAYVGSSNFIVASVVNKCADSFRGGKSAKEFTLEWQERNAKYVVAAAVYMDKRLAEALVDGGPEERKAVFDEVTSVSREYGKETLQGLFENGSKQEACDRVLGLIGDGVFDITPKVPMYDELEALTTWAQQQ